jgi:hypothetical protein
MSRLNKGLYSSEDHGWMSPPAVVDAVLSFENRDKFDLDPCCSVLNIPARFYFINGITDGLKEAWTNFTDPPLVWVNPPYGTVLKKWIQKSLEASNYGCNVWMILPCRTENHYYHSLVLQATGFTVFLRGKQEFLKNGQSKGKAGFPVMLCYYGDDWKEKAARWVANPPLEGTLMIRGGQE